MMSCSLRRFLIASCLIAMTTGLGLAEDASAKGRRAEASQSESEHTETSDQDALSRWQNATAAERQEMRDAAREKWQNASPRERRLFRRGLAGLRYALPEFTEIERLVLLRRLFAMPRTERNALRKRLRRIEDLDAQERAEFLTELRSLEALQGEEAARIERNVDRWKDMSEADRDQYREQMRRFRALSVEERRKLLDDWEAAGESPREDASRDEE